MWKQMCKDFRGSRARCVQSVKSIFLQTLSTKKTLPEVTGRLNWLFNASLFVVSLTLHSALYSQLFSHAELFATSPINCSLRSKISGVSLLTWLEEMRGAATESQRRQIKCWLFRSLRCCDIPNSKHSQLTGKVNNSLNKIYVNLLIHSQWKTYPTVESCWTAYILLFLAKAQAMYGVTSGECLWLNIFNKGPEFHHLQQTKYCLTYTVTNLLGKSVESCAI